MSDVTQCSATPRSVMIASHIATSAAPISVIPLTIPPGRSSARHERNAQRAFAGRRGFDAKRVRLQERRVRQDLVEIGKSASAQSSADGMLHPVLAADELRR